MESWVLGCSLGTEDAVALQGGGGGRGQGAGADRQPLCELAGQILLSEGVQALTLSWTVAVDEKNQTFLNITVNHIVFDK